MSQFETGLLEVKRQLFQGNLEEAFLHLNSLEPVLNANSREKAHINGIILMRKGLFQEAIDLFLKASKNYGNHVCLLADLAASYYLSGQTLSWLRILDLAEYEFEKAQDSLNWRLKVSFLLTLGKMREEQGALAEALQIYENGLKICDDHKIDPDGLKNYFKLLSQILRLKSQYGQHKSVSAYYRELIHHSAQETDWDCAFEIEHALMIFETRSWGSAEGFTRFYKLLNNPLLQTQEAALIYSDFVYELMMAGSEIPEEILKRFSELENLSPFDNVILNLAHKKHPTLDEMIEWPEKMGPSAYLRLLGLCLKKKLNESSSKKFLFIIQNLSQKSINLWVSSLEGQEFLPKDQLKYDDKSQILSFADEKLDLTNKPAFREILDLLLKVDSMPIDEAIKVLWNGEGTEADVSRLRMRVRRLNAQIEKSFAKKDLVKIMDSRLLLSLPVSTDLSNI